MLRFNYKKTDSNAEEIFDELGRELVDLSCDGRIERAFRSLGGNIIDFLTTLNSVHDVLLLDNESDNEQEGNVNREQDNDDVENDEILDSDKPGFISTTVLPESNVLELNFTSYGPPCAYLLVGILKGVAEKLYQTDINVDISTQDFIHFK